MAHNDLYRTGWQQNETILNTTTVSQNTFGLLWQYPTQGAIYAQPLTYTSPTGTNLTNCKSPCEGVFIATEEDMLYAFNANSSSSNLIWSMNLAAELGNGTFDPATPRYNYGDSVLRLDPTSLGVKDFFTPGDEITYSSNLGRCSQDVDLDSGGLIALPDDGLLANHPHLAVVADKEAKLYVVDRDNLGQYVQGSNQIVQVIQTPPQNGNVWGYWGNTAYYNSGSGTRALYYSVREANKNTEPPFPINQYSLTTSGPISANYLSTPDLYCGLGAVPSVSSNGDSSGGILWAIEATNRGNPGNCPDSHNEPGTYYMALALHAYDATQVNATPELYNGRAANINDLIMGFPVKFSTPTISNGKVFVGSNDLGYGKGSVVNVFGLCVNGPGGKCITN